MRGCAAGVYAPPAEAARARTEHGPGTPVGEAGRVIVVDLVLIAVSLGLELWLIGQGIYLMAS